MDNGLNLILIPAPDESIPVDLQTLQVELRQLPINARRLPRGLSHFRSSSGGGIFAGPHPATLDANALLALASGLATKTLGPAVVAWLHGRQGRKVRLKVGDAEVEAGSVKEAEDLIAQADKLRNTSEPKRIP